MKEVGGKDDEELGEWGIRRRQRQREGEGVREKEKEGGIEKLCSWFFFGFIYL